MSQDNIINDAEWIMSNCQPGGGITENTQAGRNQVHPYFGCYAAIGLCAAQTYAQDGRYYNAAWNWMDFIKTRTRGGRLSQNQAPGTFITDVTWDPVSKTYSNVTTNPGADSVDSYAALFVIAVYALAVVGGDPYRNRIIALRPYLENAWQNMVNCYNTVIHSSVTFPGFLAMGTAMYVEDNAEFQTALQCLMLLKEQYFDDTFAKTDFTGGVENMQLDHINNFVANFYHAGSGTWSVTNGSGAANLATTYPDAQAQILVAELLPSSLNANTNANLSTILANQPNIYQSSDGALMCNALVRSNQLKAQRQLLVATGDYEISNNRPFTGRAWVTGDIGLLLVARTNTTTKFFPTIGTT
jgi:hypothetical protein